MAQLVFPSLQRLVKAARLRLSCQIFSATLIATLGLASFVLCLLGLWSWLWSPLNSTFWVVATVTASLLVALGYCLFRVPTEQQVVQLLDRRLEASSLLTTAWDLNAKPAESCDAVRQCILSRAEGFVQRSQAQVRQVLRFSSGSRYWLPLTLLVTGLFLINLPSRHLLATGAGSVGIDAAPGPRQSIAGYDPLQGQNLSAVAPEAAQQESQPSPDARQSGVVDPLSLRPIEAVEQGREVAELPQYPDQPARQAAAPAGSDEADAGGLNDPPESGSAERQTTFAGQAPDRHGEQSGAGPDLSLSRREPGENSLDVSRAAELMQTGQPQKAMKIQGVATEMERHDDYMVQFSRPAKILIENYFTELEKHEY